MKNHTYQRKVANKTASCPLEICFRHPIIVCIYGIKRCLIVKVGGASGHINSVSEGYESLRFADYYQIKILDD